MRDKWYILEAGNAGYFSPSNHILVIICIGIKQYANIDNVRMIKKKKKKCIATQKCHK